MRRNPFLAATVSLHATEARHAAEAIAAQHSPSHANTGGHGHAAGAAHAHPSPTNAAGHQTATAGHTRTDSKDSSHAVAASHAPASSASSSAHAPAATAASGSGGAAAAKGPTMEEKFVACMVLAGVGDAMGYKSGDWEFCRNGRTIHEDMMKITKNAGISALQISLPDWPVSDDTVMLIATAKGLLASVSSIEGMLNAIAKEYVDCWSDMGGRAPGGTTAMSIDQMGRDGSRWRTISYNGRAGGCGAAMRSMCIGLAFPHADHLPALIAVSVESGRMTHHHPTGYLGSVAGALFTSYALQNVPLHAWGARMLATMPKVVQYVKDQGRDVEQNVSKFGYFVEAWTKYLAARGISDGKSPAKFPASYGVEERDKFYKSVSFDGWGGSSGHDAPMIAYDALLGCNGSWEELCLRAVLHGGDSDSTGCMAGAWFGALYGFKSVPRANHEKLEYRDVLDGLGRKLYRAVFFDQNSTLMAISRAVRKAAADSKSAPATGSAPAAAAGDAKAENKVAGGAPAAAAATVGGAGSSASAGAAASASAGTAASSSADSAPTSMQLDSSASSSQQQQQVDFHDGSSPTAAAASASSSSSSASAAAASPDSDVVMH